jgi:guanyl-specific ribonuclease Sa
MSLLDGIASAIGHTPETLAEVTGTSVGMLEKVIGGLNEEGIEVFSAASRLGLTPDGLLRGIVTTMRSGDPHQQLLDFLLSPAKSMSDPLASLTSHWLHIADLHQNTARAIDQHIQDLFGGSGTESYSGPAADTLWNTHQDFQRYFGTLIDHAETQHTRHKTLSGHMDDYASRMYSNVNSLSTPAAALALLSLDVGGSPTPVIDPKFIQGVESNAENFQQDANSDPPGLEDPVWDVFEALAMALFIFGAICQVIDWAQGILASFQSQQKSTTTPKPTPTPTPTPIATPSPGTGSGLTPDQQRLLNDVKSRLGKTTYNDADIEALIKAGYTDPDTIAAIIKGGSGTIATFDDPDIAKMMNAMPPDVQRFIVKQAEDHNYSKDKTKTILQNVPVKAFQVAIYAQAHNGAAQPGYKGNGTYVNDGRDGGQILPRNTADGKPITYKEYDVNPYTKGVQRDDERVVIGSDGRMWYTKDHYTTFIPDPNNP